MRHLVLGNGNLGNDIKTQLSYRNGQEVSYLGKGIPTAVMRAWRPDIVWCCVGAGGVFNETSKIENHLEAHLKYPLSIMNEFNGTDTRLIFFSTHYLLNEDGSTLSLYAEIKSLMESICLKYKNTCVYRVGSLYGNHRPLMTFPGKIFTKIVAKEHFSLPSNLVSPTPTLWLAEKLLNKSEHPHGVHTISPDGYMSVYEWGCSFADMFDYCIIGQRGKDYSYPFDSIGISSENKFNECAHLWNIHKTSLIESLIDIHRAKESGAYQN